MITTYDIFGQIQPSEIYLAKPGHRIIGVIPGVDIDSARLELNFNNTDVLEFTVQRIIDGEVNPYYDLINQHYELYVTNQGWFKINEEPTLSGDGNTENKSVRAESGEIELQQYDLIGFEINTGSVASAEMMAIDNVYQLDGFDLPRENVKFYRDTTALENLASVIAQIQDPTVEDLEDLLYEHPAILTSPRVDFDYETFDDAIIFTIEEYQQQGRSTAALEALIGTINHTKHGDALAIVMAYPEMRKYVDIVVDLSPSIKTDSDDSEQTLTITEVVDREIERQHRLSFLWLVLHEHGWEPGYVDPWVDPNAESARDCEKLADRIGKFDVDSQDIYSFLTQEAAGYYQCIFDFDTENYRVNAYKIENVGFDTNIFLGFHSIQNSVTRNSDRQLHTVYHIEGADNLDPTEANFGNDWIEDLSYFMNTNHFKQETIDKYNAWFEYMENHRSDFMDLAKERRKKSEVRDELYDRVPIDGCDTAQYGTFRDEELIEEIAKYQALMRGLEATYVDDDGEFDIDVMREANEKDYMDYIMMRDQIIPNIQIEIYNRGLQSDQDNRDFLDGYQYDFETYGDAYGVAELKVQMTKLNNSIRTIKEKGYNVPPEDADPWRQEQYELFQKYQEAYDEAEVCYEERLAEWQAVVDEIADIQAQMDAMKIDVAVENPQFGFTEKELELLDKYRIHIDYVNQNILVTSISTADEYVDKALELIKDAKEELYADAHPQYNFETTQDNLLLIPEFRDWHGFLGVGNFIRVGIRDDYQVRLRVTLIGFNPFLSDPTIDIQFSNMVQYASKRNDYVSLLENGRTSAKNQITSKYGVNTSNQKSTVEVDSGLMLRILNNGMFSSYLSSLGTDIVSNSVTATTAAVPGIVQESIATVDINVNQITGTDAQFENLFSEYIDSDYIVTGILNAAQGTFQQLSTEVMNAGTINVTHITGTDAQFETVGAKMVTADNVVAGLVQAQEGDFDALSANTAFIEYLNSGVITAESVTADSVVTALLEADQATIERLDASNAFIDYLEASLITASEIDVDDLKAKLATIDVANIEQLYANNAFVRSLQSLSSTAATSVINDAYIYNAVAGKIEVGDLAAGDITISDNMRILSENGNLIMNGSAIQILGEDSLGNPYVGVQLGYATNGTPSLVLRNEDGATIIDPTGITQDAIADGLIINNMIHDGTIQKGKLGFNVIEPNQQGGIDITQVYDGSGNLWGVQYTTFKQGTESALDELREDVESASYSLFIEAPNGKNIRGGNITLNAKLYRNSVDVTNDWSASYFIWTRHSLDAYGDAYWNEAHSTGTKTITITGNDVHIEADFQCRFEANGVTVTSSTGGE